MRLSSARVWRALLVALAAFTWVMGCTGFERRLAYHSVRSDLMSGARLGYSVWAPPDHRPRDRLPLIVFLHGGGDDEASFDRHGLTEEFDAAVLAGEIPRAVIFFPEGDNGFWANWYDGTRRYQDWILEELIPEVSARYGTLPCPEHCHVMGVSMGGFGSIRLLMDHPGRFATMSALSAPIFDTRQMLDFSRRRMANVFIPTRRIWGPPDPALVAQRDPFRVWRHPSDLHGTDMLLRWGSDDRESIRETNERLVEHLEEHHIPVDAAEYPGNHSWRSWSPVIREAMVRQLGHADAPADAGAEIEPP